MRKLLFSLGAVFVAVLVSVSAFAAGGPSGKVGSANHCWQQILLSGGDTYSVGTKSVKSNEAPGGPKVNFGKACTGCDGDHAPHMQVKFPSGKSGAANGVDDDDTVHVGDGATVTINATDTCDVDIDGDNVNVALSGVNGGSVTCTPSSDGTLTASNTPNGKVLDIALNGSGVQVIPLSGNIKVHN